MPLVDAVKDQPILSTIIRCAARLGHPFNKGDAAEMLLTLLEMDELSRARLASRLLKPNHDAGKPNV